MIDARISIALPSHPKTKKLIRMAGTDAAWRLICLFLWAAQNRQDGVLSGMDSEDIELAVDWPGDDGAFVSALLRVGFLDEDDGEYFIHDWHEHNPWAAGAEDRSEKAKFNALCKHHGREEAAKRMPEYAAKHQKTTTQQAISKDIALDVSASSMHVAENSTAPSLTPSLTPSPKEEEQPIVASKLAPCPHQEIIVLFAEHLPELPQPRLWDGAREKNLANRWKWVLGDLKKKGKPCDKSDGIEFFRRMFAYIAKCDLLMGKKGDWSCSLPWIVEAENFAKVIEGNYEPKAAS